jgi:hypothetical protein
MCSDSYTRCSFRIAQSSNVLAHIERLSTFAHHMHTCGGVHMRSDSYTRWSFRTAQSSNVLAHIERLRCVCLPTTHAQESCTQTHVEKYITRDVDVHELQRF